MEYQHARRIVVDFLRLADPEEFCGPNGYLHIYPGMLDEPDNPVNDKDLILLASEYISYQYRLGFVPDQLRAQCAQILDQFNQQED